ncbi:hypothetical protein FRX31_022066 [Thalictrum thalictroides]|uniref:F-box associated beta-propeller type 3 domain-containing protein n=1 Tax=Thalictrum thalictroides TaxID=46969 RepID=A0A7J6VTZ1_THATH|nr:hypothetical protein FRX31_022066 [Thalictrum thalictroides]
MLQRFIPRRDLDRNLFKISLCLPKNKIMIAGSCNGLACLSDYSTFIAICNPATNQNFQHNFRLDVKKLPSGYKRFCSLGFGCDPLMDTYKVVKVDAYYSADDLGYCEAHVYTLGTKEWRRIPTASCLLNSNTVPYLNWWMIQDGLTVRDTSMVYLLMLGGKNF